MEEFESALDHFEKALELAKELNDDDTKEAILKAMEDVNLKLSHVPSMHGQEDLGEGPSGEMKREEESLKEPDVVSEDIQLPRPHEAKSI